MLMVWDLFDPVSQKEKDRNEAVYLIQGNRNPFIDNPAYVNLIWGTQNGTEETGTAKSLKVWPNPAIETVTVELPDTFSGLYDIRFIDISGNVIMNKSVSGKPLVLDISTLRTGFYIIEIKSKSESLFAPLIVNRR